MNLRLQENNRRKKDDEKKQLLTTVVCFVLSALMFSSILIYTLHLNGENSEITRKITNTKKELNKFKKEIKNIKIKLEHYTRKEFVMYKIREYNLGLSSPEHSQVVNLNKEQNTITEERKLAYNSYQ